MTKSGESTTDLDIDSSEIWFNQNYVDPDDPESGFDATFTKTNATSAAPVYEVDNSTDEINVFEGFPSLITSPVAHLSENMTSEGESLTLEGLLSHADCEGYISMPRDYKTTKVKVRFK